MKQNIVQRSAQAVTLAATAFGALATQEADAQYPNRYQDPYAQVNQINYGEQPQYYHRSSSQTPSPTYDHSPSASHNSNQSHSNRQAQGPFYPLSGESFPSNRNSLSTPQQSNEPTSQDVQVGEAASGLATIASFVDQNIRKITNPYILLALGALAGAAVTNFINKYEYHRRDSERLDGMAGRNSRSKVSDV